MNEDWFEESLEKNIRIQCLKSSKNISNWYLFIIFVMKIDLKILPIIKISDIVVESEIINQISSTPACNFKVFILFIFFLARLSIYYLLFPWWVKEVSETSKFIKIFRLHLFFKSLAILKMILRSYFVLFILFAQELNLYRISLVLHIKDSPICPKFLR